MFLVVRVRGRTGMMKITCIIESLACGGSERSMATLASMLDKRGHEITLLTRHSDTPDFYRLPDSVQRAYAHPDSNMDCRWFDWRCQTYRNSVLRTSILATEPEVVISFITVNNILVLMALSQKNIPVIVSERTDPRLCRVSWRWNLRRRLHYPRADKVVIQSEDLLPWAQSHWPRWDTAVVHNPVLPPDSEATTNRPEVFKKENNVVTVGRLAPEKRYELLLEVFADLAHSHPTWQLTILGDGPSRPGLQHFLETKNLQDRVILPGAVKNPTEIVRHADLYVLTSRFEGFPNALAEAMAHGVPAISFDCPVGPRTIIRHETDGLLVPDGDRQALKSAMERLMGDSYLRDTFAERAGDVVQRFSVKTIADRWENIIKEAVLERAK